MNEPPTPEWMVYDGQSPCMVGSRKILPCSCLLFLSPCWLCISSHFGWKPSCSERSFCRFYNEPLKNVPQESRNPSKSNTIPFPNSRNSLYVPYLEFPQMGIPINHPCSQDYYEHLYAIQLVGISHLKRLLEVVFRNHTLGWVVPYKTGLCDKLMCVNEHEWTIYWPHLWKFNHSA